MSNLATFDRNVLHALSAFPEGDEAATMYLRHIDKDGRRIAERRAVLWAEISPTITVMVRSAERLSDGRDHGVRDYIKGRFENMAVQA